MSSNGLKRTRTPSEDPLHKLSIDGTTVEGSSKDLEDGRTTALNGSSNDKNVGEWTSVTGPAKKKQKKQKMKKVEVRVAINV